MALLHSAFGPDTDIDPTILSKLNYRIRLYVNMNIADSISFYFNLGKGHHFVLRVKQQVFDKVRFFK